MLCLPPGLLSASPETSVMAPTCLSPTLQGHELIGWKPHQRRFRCQHSDRGGTVGNLSGKAVFEGRERKALMDLKLLVLEVGIGSVLPQELSACI